MDPAIPTFDVHTLEEERAAALAQQRLVAMLSTAFGALALLLTCVGLYGLLAYTWFSEGARWHSPCARRTPRRHRLAHRYRAMVMVAVGTAIEYLWQWEWPRLASNQSWFCYLTEATDPSTFAAAGWRSSA